MPRESTTSSPVPTQPVRLTGWGRIAPSKADLTVPASAAEAVALLRYLATPPTSKAGTAIPRGLGRSYNNAAQSADGIVISSGKLNNIISFDHATGVVERRPASPLSSSWSPGCRTAGLSRSPRAPAR